jgi:hypothetical protein
MVIEMIVSSFQILCREELFLEIVAQLGHPCCKQYEISSTSTHVTLGYNVFNQTSVNGQASSGNKNTALMSTSVKKKKITNLQYSTIRHSITNLKVAHCILNVSPLT